MFDKLYQKEDNLENSREMNPISKWLQNRKRKQRVKFFGEIRVLIPSIEDAAEKYDVNARKAALTLLLKELPSFGADRLRKQIFALLENKKLSSQ